MKLKIDSEIKEVDTEKVVNILRSMTGKVDKISITTNKQVEDKKTLSDKMGEITFKVNAKLEDLESHEVNDIILDIEKLFKQHIKEFLDWFYSTGDDEWIREPTPKQKAKQIFGKELID